jgi:hypothetical protein
MPDRSTLRRLNTLSGPMTSTLRRAQGAARGRCKQRSNDGPVTRERRRWPAQEALHIALRGPELDLSDEQPGLAHAAPPGDHRQASFAPLRQREQTR